MDRCNAMICVAVLNRVAMSYTVYVADVDFRVHSAQGVNDNIVTGKTRFITAL